MPGTYWRVAQGFVEIPGHVVGEGDDWRIGLQPGSRHRVVYTIMETFRRRCHFSGQGDLEKKALVLEEKIFNEATSQSDYLRKISLKMLALVMKSQNPKKGTSLHSTAARNSRIPQHPCKDSSVAF